MKKTKDIKNIPESNQIDNGKEKASNSLKELLDDLRMEQLETT